MNLEKIKTQLEANKSFLYWKDSIGLSFEDFSIYKPLNDFKWEILKEGKKDIGTYYIVLKKDEVDKVAGAYFDMNNETVRQNTLKKISKVS